MASNTIAVEGLDMLLNKSRNLELLSYIQDQIKSATKEKESQQRNIGGRADSILEEALTCFAELKNNDITIPLIAKRIGVSHSLIYYYFRDKETLFRLAIMHALTLVMKEYETLLMRESGAEEMINAYLRLNVEMSGTLRSLVRIMLIELSSEKDESSKFVESFIHDFYKIEHNILHAAVLSGVGDGVFKCDDAHAMARFISRNIDAIYYGSFMRHGEDIATAMSYLKKVVFQILRRENPAQVAS